MDGWGFGWSQEQQDAQDRSRFGGTPEQVERRLKKVLRAIDAAVTEGRTSHQIRNQLKDAGEALDKMLSVLTEG